MNYHGYDKPFIFCVDYRTENNKNNIFEKLEKDGINLYFPNGFNKKEERYLKCAHAVLAFVDKKTIKDENFRKTIDCAVSLNKQILCIYLDEVEKDPWSIMQLDSQQALFTKDLDEEFYEKLKKSEIFKEMKLTNYQKSFQKRRGILFVAIPLIVAVFVFVTIINPLLIEPKRQQQSFLDSLGLGNLTQEEIDNVKEIYIVGDRVFTDFVHAWYDDPARREVVYNYEVEDGHQEFCESPTPIGTISDLSQITIFRNLEKLFIEGNQIEDISPIFELSNLREIGFNCNPITSIEGIEKLKNLQTVNLAYTDINDITPLFKCTNLSGIQIENVKVRSIEGIENLKNLEGLRMSDAPISDISPLKECKMLRDLKITNTNVKDLSVISELNYLSYFEAEGNNINHIPSLNQNNLSIWLRRNSISDYSFLNGLNTINEFVTDVNNDQYNLLINVNGKIFSKFIVAGLNITSLNELSGIKIRDYGELNISHCYNLVSLEGIDNFLNISILDLKYAYNLEDLTPILDIKNLEILTLSSDMRERAEQQLANRTFEINYRDD